LKAPPYCPVQDPERTTAGGTAVGVAVGVADGVLVATGVLVGGMAVAAVGVGVVVVVDALQAASRVAAAPVSPMTSARFILVSPLFRCTC
jgi:hypothetical protein